MLLSCQAKGCRSDDVFTFEGDVFCHACGWNSIEVHVGAQIDDHIRRWKNGQEKTPLALPDLDVNDRGFEALFVAVGVA